MKKLQVKVNGEWTDYTAPRVDMVTFSDSTEDVRLIDQDECHECPHDVTPTGTADDLAKQQPEIELSSSIKKALDRKNVVNKDLDKCSHKKPKIEMKEHWVDMQEQWDRVANKSKIEELEDEVERMQRISGSIGERIEEIEEIIVNSLKEE